MEGLLLPEGSGGEEPPEEPQDVLDASERAMELYNAKMWLFEQGLSGHTVRRRRRMSDYTTKNCEEAYGGREGRPAEADGVG